MVVFSLFDLHLTRMAEHIQRRVPSAPCRVSSEMTVPPVRMAISCSISLRRSPKPGALTATQVNVPRSLLTTSVDSASPSTSSAMMSSFLPSLHHLLQQGQDFLNDGNLLVGDKDQRIIQHRFHLFGIGHHVGGRIAAVELHPFDDGHARGHGLAFFHGDNAVRADSFHCVGNQLADGFIRSGVRGDVGNRLLAVDGLGQFLQAFHGGIRRGGNALLQHHGVCAGGEVAADLRG